MACDRLALSHDRLGSIPAGVAVYLGCPFVYPIGSNIGTIIAAGWEWDRVLRTIVPALLTEEDPIICEVGSNIGASLLQILAVKPRARVLAFEPSDRFLPFFQFNLELARIDHIEVFQLLVGREPGERFIYNDTSSGSVNDWPQYSERHLTSMTTLDEIFRDREGVELIKVDTNGYDLEVLRGGEVTLTRHRPAVHFEFAPCLMRSANLEPTSDLAWLQGLGYRRLVCLTPAGQLVGVTEDAEQAVSWADENWYCDILACPAGSWLDERLESQLLGKSALTKVS